MKKILAIMATGLLLASCSNDDHNADADFYGLRQGRVLVYKKYTVDESEEVTKEDMFAIDTVTITANEKLAGLTYFRLHHKIYKDAVLQEESDDYRRVNDKGYLVNENGIVIHPGFEINYTHTDSLKGAAGEELGTIFYQMRGVKDIDVEGATYTVYPYLGIVTPINNSVPAGEGEETCYTTLGLIKQRVRYLSASIYLEDRLVYYKL